MRLGGGETPKIDAELGQYRKKGKKEFLKLYFPIEKEEKKGAKFKKKRVFTPGERKRYDFRFSPLIVSPKEDEEEKGNRGKQKVAAATARGGSVTRYSGGEVV